MDNTGTLTKGQPEVTDVVVDGIDDQELLGLLAAVESASEHPLAAAIVTRRRPRHKAVGCQRLPQRTLAQRHCRGASTPRGRRQPHVDD
jgi:cation transport ATPase